MATKEVLTQLEALGNEKVQKQNAKHGAGDKQFGVKLGYIRSIAKKIKVDHELALSLWKTGNVDARFLAALIIDRKTLSADEMNSIVKLMTFDRVPDWVNSYVVKHHTENETLRKKWIEAEPPMAARAGKNLTSIRIKKNTNGVNLSKILDTIQTQMLTAAPAAQWTMNFAFAETGLNHPTHRDRTIAVGEKSGLYRDYPVSKGCTFPFAPIWIHEMVSRQ